MNFHPRHSLVAAAMILESMAACANSYTIVDLGRYRYPYQVNDGGQVAARYIHEGRPERALARRADAWHLLSGISGEALAIDVDGTAGGSIFSGKRPQTARTWGPDGKTYEYEFPQDSMYSGVFGISHGQAVGYFSPAGHFHCFVAGSQGGTATDLGMIPDQTDCFATAINASRQIVGHGQNNGGDPFAFLWENGAFTVLDGLPGGTTSYASAINDAGHVLGESLIQSEWHAFLWQDGVTTDLAPSTRIFQTLAMSINNEDEIVGQAFYKNGRRHRAVRFEGGRVVDLDKEIVNVAGWHLDIATSVNNSGAIVGWGDYLGEQHCFMLVPQDAGSRPRSAARR